MTRDELNALATRVEQLDGPSQGMDAEIALAVGGWTPPHYDAWCHFQEAGDAANPPLYEPAPPNPYTSSIDAALTIVPEGYDYILARTNDGLTIHAQVGDTHMMFGALPALALTAAALRAHALLA